MSRQRVWTKKFAVKHWTVVDSVLRGPRGVNLDLFLYREGGRKALARSARPRSRERIREVVRPGRYELLVYAYRGRGTAKLRVAID